MATVKSISYGVLVGGEELEVWAIVEMDNW